MLILTVILPLISLYSNAQETYDDLSLSFSHVTADSRRQADSLMRVVVAKAAFYTSAVSRYETEIYIKGRTEILKKNALIRYANRIFPVDRRNPDMLFEMVTDTEYDAPNNFQHTIKAIHGNSIPDTKKQDEVLAFLNINIYSPIVYNDAIIMPMARNSHRYYHFNIESVDTISGAPVYKIRFLPKQWTQKLVCGDMWIRDGSWTIQKIDFSGRVQFAQFNISMEFGNGANLIIPERSKLNLRYKVLGNVVETNYHMSYHFKEIEWVEEDNFKSKWKPLDLTQYYTLTMDSVPIINDSAYWDKERDVPLTEDEAQAITHITPQASRIDTTNMVRYLDLTEQLTSSMRFDYGGTRFRYSGILNPAQLGYSARNGITYKQRLRINKTYASGQSFYFRPEVGFVFKRKEVFFKVYGDWQYKPEKKGGISLMVANGNDGYSSEMMKKINEHLKDSAFNFNDLQLTYFRHYYVDIKNHIELSNGLLFNAGLAYHSHVPIDKAVIDPGDDVEEMINHTYNDFTPTLGFVYTPRQFYRMVGRQKEYVYSYYPTISVELARAIPGVLNSSTDFGRIEMDVQQSLPMGLLKRLNYHVSGGTYFNFDSSQAYFADFTYFTRRNFPDSWNDQIGGVFNLLGREWYNAANKYVQAHLMYESPFILFQIFQKNATKHVLSERFYLGQLWTPVLPCYTEVGYGFGNYLFSVAAFAAFDRGRYDGIGFKFAFELFQ